MQQHPFDYFVHLNSFLFLYPIECAQVISDDFKKYVEWVTPLGLRVSQPYTKQAGGKRIDLDIATKVSFNFRPNVSRK